MMGSFSTLHNAVGRIQLSSWFSLFTIGNMVDSSTSPIYGWYIFAFIEISLNKELSKKNWMSSRSLDFMISKVLKWSLNSLDSMFWSFQKIDWQTAFIKLLSKEFNGCSWKSSIKRSLSSLLKSLNNNGRAIEENVKLLRK